MKNMWQHICDHNSGKSGWILIFFTYLQTGMCPLQAFSNMCTCLPATGLLCVWHSLEHLPIDDAIDQWLARLRACVRANGGHF